MKDQFKENEILYWIHVLWCNLHYYYIKDNKRSGIRITISETGKILIELTL